MALADYVKELMPATIKNLAEFDTEFSDRVKGRQRKLWSLADQVEKLEHKRFFGAPRYCAVAFQVKEDITATAICCSALITHRKTRKPLLHNRFFGRKGCTSHRSDHNIFLRSSLQLGDNGNWNGGYLVHGSVSRAWLRKPGKHS